MNISDYIDNIKPEDALHYRPLTQEEKCIMQINGCHSSDWDKIKVAQGFQADKVRHTNFSGDIFIGSLEPDPDKPDFPDEPIIENASLNNVLVGDSCNIRNVFGSISDSVIGHQCRISDLGSITASPSLSFKLKINVLAEDGSVSLPAWPGMEAPIAALLLKYLCENGNAPMPDLPPSPNFPLDLNYIDDNTIITGTKSISGLYSLGNVEINGATSLKDCVLIGSDIMISDGAICEKVIVGNGSSISRNAILSNCFVGDFCHITNQFSASNCLFFQQSEMSGGEAEACFFGPFSVSHHKSTLLIGGQFSFFNAGSASNFSNHAYKMGPLHYGQLATGCKTASSCHIVWPANIGEFSTCFGEIRNHPDTSLLPFSYVIGKSDGSTLLIPGKNIFSAGSFRDMCKWRERDKSGLFSQFSLFNPLTATKAFKAAQILMDLKFSHKHDPSPYISYNGCVIRVNDLDNGILAYGKLYLIFLSSAMKNFQDDDNFYKNKPTKSHEWTSLAELLYPKDVVDDIINKMADGSLASYHSVEDFLKTTLTLVPSYKNITVANMLKQLWGRPLPDANSRKASLKAFAEGLDFRLNEWKQQVEQDARREFSLGDIPEATLNSFLSKLDDFNL